MRTWTIVVGLGVLLAGWARADQQCMWGGRFYDSGAESCQNGSQWKCVSGMWHLSGERCAGQAADPSGEEDVPAVAEPAVAEPSVGDPGVGGPGAPSVPPVGND